MPHRAHDTVGHYRLLEKLGEGGMGEVYLAEQTEPVKRRVALKVLKAGMDTKAVLARFEAERQALALMEHANIAKVFDAGETDRGLPYFVMELVKGEPVTTYCDRHNLPIRERLKLFIPVCHAIQHAHHKGIIHRDLKPSNILVTASDDQPLPKVIDFGIAKATAAALTDKTLFTEQGQLVGTPEYMSPEQAEMGGLDVDTRTDVYSLGVVLYELLTGVLPFDPEALRRAGLARIHEIIREEEPKKPSTKVSTLGEKSTNAARARRTEVARLARQLRGDLDWIVLRAMEKDRTRRYETANTLAMDIARYLRDEPVFAGPPSAAYRMRKFAKRHRVALAFAAVVIGSISYAGVESNRRSVVAQKAHEESEAVTAFLAGMLGAVDPGKKGKDVTVREVLDEAATTIEKKFEAQPLVRARLMDTMGGVYRKLGQYAEARSLLESALAIREKELGADHPEVAASLNNLANLLSNTGEYAAARPLYERALAIREKTEGPEDPEVAKSLNNLAVLLRATGDYAAARPLYERALAIREKALGPDHPELANSLNNLAVLLRATGDYAQARSLHERALAIREKALGPDHVDVAQSLGGLALLLRDTGDLAGARRMSERSLSILERTLGPDHPNVAAGQQTLATLLSGAKNYAEARQLLERALATLERTLEPDHPHVALALSNLGGVLQESGDLAGARPLHERALAIREKALGPNHPDVAQSLDNLALLHAANGDYAKAIPLSERALAIQEKARGPEHVEVATALCTLASIRSATGNNASARPLYERALAIMEKAQGPDHPSSTRLLDDLARTLRALGQPARADSLEARARSIREEPARPKPAGV